MGARPLQMRAGTKENSGLRKTGKDINDAITVRVDAAVASKATVPVPSDARAELKALRRQTLARIAAEKAASPLDASPTGIAEPAPDEVAPAAAPASTIDEPEAVGLPPRAPTHQVPASEATTVRVQKLRVRREVRPEVADSDVLSERPRNPRPRVSEDRVEEPRTPEPSAPPWPRIAAVALVAVVMFGVGRWLSRDRQASIPPTVAPTAPALPGPVSEARPEHLARANSAPAEKLETPPVETASAAVVEPGPAAVVVSAPSASASLGTSATKSKEPVASPTSEPKADAPATAVPTNGLDPASARSALARAGARAASCTDPKGGRGLVSVTFDPDGTANHVTMSGPYEGTPVASCVVQIFRAASVPPFEGAPAKVFQTIELPGDGKTLQ